MIICGERLVIEESSEENAVWKCCVLPKDDYHRNGHKFEGREFTEKKCQAILKINTSFVNQKTPFWFSRQHHEFEQWTRDQQISFGIRFMTHAKILKWGLHAKIFFLYNISRDHHYVNDVLELNEICDKTVKVLVHESERDPKVKAEIEESSKEATEYFLDRISQN